MITDEPLSNSTNDKLGFGNIERHLASAFLLSDLSRGFVVGVEGPWGSGKSSLVNLALEEIRNRDGGAKVVKFAPWLVGSRNELLAQLFSDLEPVILQEIPDSEKDKTAAILRRYAQASAGLSVLADLANAGGMPFSAILSKILKKTGEKATEISETSLSDLNNQLREKLEQLKHPIVVFIDDLDRLDPSEVVEVLRLVKAVADFPNIAYILAYDQDVISHSLQGALGITDGKSYLEKIVQASFKVPRTMSFDLRNWMQDEVSLLLDGLAMSETVADRLVGVYHQWGGEYLETPRDVVRVVNSLRLNFMPVRDQIDPGDMVFLQIVRTKNVALFNWIESYVSSLSAIGDWGHILPGAHKRVGRELLMAIDKEGEEQRHFIYALDEHLPGLVSASLIKGANEFRVFAINDAEELAAFSAERRLASPNHYSYFFSFAAPSGSLNESIIQQFLIECEKAPEQAVSRFRQMIKEKRPHGGSLAEVLLDRIVAVGTDVSATQVRGLFQVLGDTIDELIPFVSNHFGYAQLLRGNRHEVFGLIERVQDDGERASIIEMLFSNAKSLAWLSGIIRDITFSQGIYGDRAQPKENWLLSQGEFQIARDIFTRRLSDTPPSKLLGVPFFLSLMYAWYQVEDANVARSWIKEQTRSDSGFLDVLDKKTSWSNSAQDGVRYTLRSETLDTFFDGVDEVAKRLDTIANDELAGDKMRRDARDFLIQLNVSSYT